MSIKMQPTSRIKARLGINPNGKIQKFFTNTCYKHMAKYVPRDRGNLNKNVDITSTTITYESPYAHYMYEGLVMGPNIPIKEDGVIVGWFSRGPKYYTGEEINYNQGAGHEYAGPHWDQRMWSAEKDEVISEVQQKIGGK